MKITGKWTLLTGFLSTIVLLFTYSPVISAEDLHPSEYYSLQSNVITGGLEHPWGMAFLPDGSLLITERAGRLRHFKDGELSPPIKGLPPIAAGGQGGLLDVALAPDYANSHRIYLSFSEPSKDQRQQGTALMRARFVPGPAPHLTDVETIFTQNRKTSTQRHFGSRIVITPDHTLFLTIGDRGDRMRAQDPHDHAGSILRFNLDGSVPPDNPFADGKQGAPEIWSTGHRNPQGATWNTVTQKLWTVEHGAKGGDEINRPQKGKNYGWPIISYGRHYSGQKIGHGTHKPGMEQPLYYWDPSIAPSGLSFYHGTVFKKWQGNLFVGALKDRMLVRLVFDGEKVIHEERMFENTFGRIRDVREGPDGYLYLLTDEPDGQVIQLRPGR